MTTAAVNDLAMRKRRWVEKVHPGVYQLSRYKMDKMNWITNYALKGIPDNFFASSPLLDLLAEDAEITMKLGEQPKH